MRISQPIFECTARLDSEVKFVHDLLDAAAARDGTRIAIACDRDGAASYQRLRDDSLELHELLRQQNAGCGGLVMIATARRGRAISAMFAVSRLGGAWVACHPRDPVPRLELLIALCRPAAIIADETTLGKVKEALSRIAEPPLLLVMSGERSWIDHGTGARLALDPVDRKIAHLIFTSGSTKAPKGVLISHAAVLHYAQWAMQAFGMTPADRVGSTAPFNFDMSTFDIFGAVAAGATIQIIPDDDLIFPSSVLKRLRDGRVTIWKGAASLVGLIARSGALRMTEMSDLRILAFAGETMSAAQIRTWVEHAPQVRFFNAYGPTEATGVSVLHEVRMPLPADLRHPPIGRPRPGINAYVVDQQLQPVPQGQAGELLLGGTGLAEGYWQQPEETARRFIQAPSHLRSEGGERLYRTGDLVTQDAAGLLWFLGRSDDEIKVGGHRVNALAIADALRTHPGVTQAAVLLSEDPRANTTMLIGFVCLKEGANTKDVSAWLRQQLPSYMCPRKLVEVSEMPLNDRGKVDRNALLSIAAAGNLSARQAL
jgi:amino acid adenylation domain-containing protein